MSGWGVNLSSPDGASAITGLLNSPAPADADVSTAPGGAAPEAQDNPYYGKPVVGFDVNAARAAGYPDTMIASFLASKTGFDLAQATKAGYDSTDVINYLAPPKVEPVEPADDANKTGAVAGWIKGLVSGVGVGLGQGGSAGSEFAAKSLFAADQHPDGTIAAFDAIDKGEAPPVGSINGHVAARYAAASPDERAAMRTNANAAPEFNKDLSDIAQPATDAGHALSQLSDQILTPEEKSRTGVQIARMGGGLLPLLGAAYVGDIPALIGVGGLQAYGQGYDEAKTAGKSDEEAANIGAVNGIVQAGLMAVPIHTAMNVLDAIPAAAKVSALKAIIEVAKSSATMVGFSQLSTIAENATAKATGLDPDRDIMQGVGDNMGIQAVVGALIPVVGAGAHFAGAAADTLFNGPAAKAAADGRPPPGAPDNTKLYSDDDIEQRISGASSDAKTVADTFNTDSVDEAAKVASDAATGDVPVTDQIAAGKDALDDAMPAPERVSFDNSKIVDAPDGDYAFQSTDADGDVDSVPMKVVLKENAPDDDSGSGTGPNAVAPDLAAAERNYFDDKMGFQTVFYAEDSRIPFEGAASEDHPNTIFLSNDPDRNAAQVAGHEVDHLFGAKTVTGDSVLELLDAAAHDYVRDNMTPEGMSYALERFKGTAPSRDLFPAGEEGAADFQDAVVDHLVTELKADAHGEAPKFDDFYPKVMAEVEKRYGPGVVNSVLQQLLDGLRKSMEVLKGFFGNQSQGTFSQHAISGIGNLHDIFAKMQAERLGGEIDRKVAAMPDAVSDAERGDFLKNGTPPPPVEMPAEHPLGPAFVDAKTKSAKYAKWLGEFGAQRDAAAANSTEVRTLRQTEASILAKVGRDGRPGPESRLTGVKLERLAQVRKDLAAAMNPTHDTPDMAQIRESMVKEHGRMADLAAVKPRGPRFSPRQEGTPAFKNWFGDSKAVDSSGEPQELFHGTSKDSDFNTIRIPKNGAWLTTDPESASSYSLENDSRGFRPAGGFNVEETNTASRVMPVYLKAENPKTYTDPKEFNSEIMRLGGENYKRGQSILFDRLRAAGFDSVVLGRPDDAEKVWIALKDSTQIKSSIGNRGTFDPAKKNITFSPRGKNSDGISQPGVDVKAGNAHGFVPELRVKVDDPPEFAIDKKGKPTSLMMQTTTNGNAARQLGHIDSILSQFPEPTASVENWSRMMAYALGSDEVPVPPYAFIRDLNSDGAANKVSGLSAGKISDANHGFAQAAAFRKAYESGQISPATTGKLFLWSFLSRGVSPYMQEGLFIDAFNGAAPWIKRATEGNFTKEDLPAYAAWAKTVTPKGSGQPGAGAVHNLNAFGKNFLLNMAQRGADGVSHMQKLHDMFSDPNMTGQQIRREFLKFGEGVGIDNKVVSFTLLVAGHPDVMVIDRVQTRQLWDDGRFEGQNIYDGKKDAEGKVVTGTGLANLTYGARGLLIYEAVERGLQSKINDVYTEAGRPQDASVGRYHWESWVAYSQQEASHGTLQAILDEALRPGDRSAIVGVTAKQGEYGAYEYGARYGRGADGKPYFSYDVPGGSEHEFSVPAFRAFLEDIKKPATGVVPTKFKVTDSGNGPWYDRPEVNRAKLEAVAQRWADRDGEGALRGSGGRADIADGPQRGGTGPGPNAPGLRFSPKRDENAFAAIQGLRAGRADDASASLSFARRSRGDGQGPGLLKSLGVSYDAEWKAGPELRKAFVAGGINVPARILELSPGDETNASKFEAAIVKAKAESKFGAAVAVYPPEDYRNFRLLMSDDGKSGAAIKPDGDIVSVFANNGTGHAIMEAAIAAGGRKLDAFDTNLPAYYHMHGFVEAARVPWDEAQKPEGWDKERFGKYTKGEPDVVLMALDRNDTSPVLEEGPLFKSWDEAAAAQDAMVNRFAKEAPGSVINLRLDRLDGQKALTASDAKAAIEKTGAQVIAQRTRRINGAEGEPGVVMHLSRPLSPDEAHGLSTDLGQEAIPQFANNRGDMHGPGADSYGPFDKSQFHALDEGRPLNSPRMSPGQIERLEKIHPDFATAFRKPVREMPKANAPDESVKNDKAEAPPEKVEAGETGEGQEIPADEMAALAGTEAEAIRTTEISDSTRERIKNVARNLAVRYTEGAGKKIWRAFGGEETRALRNAPQQLAAAKMADTDPQRAILIAMLVEHPPKNMLASFFAIELERRATLSGDKDLRELLHTSPLRKAVTDAGRLVQSFSTRDSLSTGALMDQVARSREDAAAAAVKNTYGDLPTAQKTVNKEADAGMKAAVKAQVMKKPPPLEAFKNLVDSLMCR